MGPEAGLRGLQQRLDFFQHRPRNGGIAQFEFGTGAAIDPPLQHRKFIGSDLGLELRRHVILIRQREEQAGHGGALGRLARDHRHLLAVAR